MIERVLHEGKELALIVRAGYRADGIQFFTPGTYSQQLGYMNRPAGYVIPPHVHNAVPREVQFTKEVLLVRSGRMRVDFYSDTQQYLRSTVLETGDVILLAFGGHGFEMLEPTEMIEIKQGPYAGDMDKTRFEPVARDRIRIGGGGDA
jgi:mannose-6-phosphate isomerase-like protein (cupin superfamily)